MSELLTCASCGEKKELCGSCRSGGIQQPKMCKECMMGAMYDNFESMKINDVYYLRQLSEVGDAASYKALIKDLPEADQQKLTTLYGIWSKDAKKTEVEKKVMSDVQTAKNAGSKPVEAKGTRRTKKVRKGK